MTAGEYIDHLNLLRIEKTRYRDCARERVFCLKSPLYREKEKDVLFYLGNFEAFWHIFLAWSGIQFHAVFGHFVFTVQPPNKLIFRNDVNLASVRVAFGGAMKNFAKLRSVVVHYIERNDVHKLIYLDIVVVPLLPSRRVFSIDVAVNHDAFVVSYGRFFIEKFTHSRI